MFEDRILEIGEEILRLHQIKNSLLDVIWANETLPSLISRIGQCYKLENSYGSPGPNDKWWVYYKIIGVSPDQKQFIVEMFQECVPYGVNSAKAEFEIQTSYPHHFDGITYILIELEEYNKERKKIIRNLSKSKMLTSQ